MTRFTLLSALCAVALYAAPITFEPLSITSDPLGEDDLSAPYASDIYTQADLERANAANLYDFLSRYSALSVMPAYGNPFSQKLDMHGFGIDSGYQNIVITLDGRRLSNIDMTAPLLAAISPQMIECIEIIKGAGIVAGGDGATAGAIHIRTKRAAANEVRLAGGPYDTLQGGFNVGGEGEGYRYGVTLDSSSFGGTRTIDDKGERDVQGITNAAFNLALNPTKALQLGLLAQLSRADVHYGGPMSLGEYRRDPAQAGSGYGYGAAPTHQRFKDDHLGVDMRYDLGADWALTARYGVEKKESEYVTYQSVSTYDYRSYSAALVYEDDTLGASFGGDGFEGLRESRGNETAKNNASLFAQARYRFDRHSLRAGYRLEQVDYRFENAAQKLDDTHTLWGAELGYNYRIDAPSSLFISLARAYQSPDVDRFFTADFATGTVAFNGFIDPMSVTTATLGYQYIDPSVRFKASLYYSSLEDEIYYYADPAWIASRNTNIDRSHKMGGDLFGGWIPQEWLRLSLSYQYVRAIIDEEVQNGERFSDKELPGVSNHSVKASIDLSLLEALTLGVAQIYRSESYSADDFANTQKQKQEAYRSTDLSLQYAGPNYRLFARINNLFNQKNALWIHDDALYPVNFTTTASAGVAIQF
ncbi:MAG: TonB-dependent receptor plug domain-containing protein [Campylobacterales bacterium]|nr:TonB-dependent receptor plug domain-containing protein [Campylobacterales bacterium]